MKTTHVEVGDDAAAVMAAAIAERARDGNSIARQLCANAIGREPEARTHFQRALVSACVREMETDRETERAADARGKLVQFALGAKGV